MYKHVALLVRAADLSHEAFVDRWLDGPPGAPDVEGVVRSHAVVPTDPEHAEFDGIAETYFESLEDLEAALGTPGASGRDDHEFAALAREDAGELLDLSATRRFVGREVLQRDRVGGDTDGLYKHAAYLVRKDGMSHDAFRDYWEHQHTPLARDIEGVVRYHTVYPADPETAPFDGVAELYFETLDDLYAALGSPGSRDYDPTKEIAAKARADVDNFLAVERRPRLIGREHVLADRTDAEGY